MRRIPSAVAIGISFGVLSIAALRAPQTHAASIYLDSLYGVSVTKNVVYQNAAISPAPTTKAYKLDIYQPTATGAAPLLTNRPAIVIQDGGSWVSASKEHSRVTDPAFYFAQRGYTVIVTDYRQGAISIPGVVTGGDVVPRVGLTQFGTAPYNGLTMPSVYTLFPGTTAVRAGIEDFAVAMAWTRTNAASLGIDPTRIAAVGGSAGGIDDLMLQYNMANGVNPLYAAQAVIGLVSTMGPNSGRIRAGAPPVFMLNNQQDSLVPYTDVPAFMAKLTQLGVYNEQWFQPSDPLYHDVDYSLNLGGENVMERMRDFLAYHFSGGPILVPEPSTFALAFTGLVGLGIVALRKKQRRA